MKKSLILLILLALPCAVRAQAQDAAQVRQLKADLELARESYDRLKELFVRKDTEIKDLNARIAGFSRQFGDFQQV
ncbi:MAG: hypothetical protein ACM3OC_08990, partial [Deltaproteobacteria bacterium]